MLLAITSEGKLGLGILAGAFIVFALLSAFYFPRRNPDFPGKRLGLYIPWPPCSSSGPWRA